MLPPYSIRKTRNVIQEDPLIVDFILCLKPILLRMRVGIWIDPLIDHSVASRYLPVAGWFRQSYGFVVLFYTISVNILVIIFSFDSIFSKSLKKFNILTNKGLY